MATYGTAIKVGLAFSVSNTGNPSAISYAVPVGSFAKVLAWVYTTNSGVGTVSYLRLSIGGVIMPIGPVTGVVGPNSLATLLTPGGLSAPYWIVGPGQTILVEYEVVGSGGGIESTAIHGTLFSNG